MRLAWLFSSISLLFLHGLAKASSDDCESMKPDEVLVRQWASSSPSAMSDYASYTHELNSEIQNRVSQLSNSNHRPRLLQHRRVTEYVVVLTHGVFMSPFYYCKLAQVFHRKGMNVYLPLLPKHWNSEIRSLDQVSYSEWISSTRESISRAKHFGRKVILAGHSLGGLLSVFHALDKPDEIKGLFLFSPALDLSNLAHPGVGFGAFIGSNGNFWTGLREDGQYTPYFSAHAGREVRRLSEMLLNQFEPPENSIAYTQLDGYMSIWARQRRLFGRIRIPVFVADAYSDRAIDTQTNSRFINSIGAPKKHLILRSADHNTTAIPSRLSDPLLRELTDAIEEFINQNFSGR